MSAHWRLAFWYAGWTAALSIPVGVAILLAFGDSHAGAFYYGVGIGVSSFVSMAGAVSLLTGRSRVRRLVGAILFVARYGVVVGALGVPAYLGLWPVAAMLLGFAAVYLAENAVLLPKVFMAGSVIDHAVHKEVERKVKV